MKYYTAFVAMFMVWHGCASGGGAYPLPPHTRPGTAPTHAPSNTSSGNSPLYIGDGECPLDNFDRYKISIGSYRVIEGGVSIGLGFIPLRLDIPWKQGAGDVFLPVIRGRIRVDSLMPLQMKCDQCRWIARLKQPGLGQCHEELISYYRVMAVKHMKLYVDAMAKGKLHEFDDPGFDEMFKVAVKAIGEALKAMGASSSTNEEIEDDEFDEDD